MKNLVVSLLALGILSACSSNEAPTFGEALIGQGKEVEVIGEQWEDGNELIEEGSELVEEGKEDIAEGKDLIYKGEKIVNEGQEKIVKGRKLKESAEEAYKMRSVVQ